MNDYLELALAESPPPYGAAVQTPELELPDWSGQIKGPSTLSMDEMLRYCEANLPHLRTFPGYRQRRLAPRCEVEFVL